MKDFGHESQECSRYFKERRKKISEHFNPTATIILLHFCESSSGSLTLSSMQTLTSRTHKRMISLHGLSYVGWELLWREILLSKQCTRSFWFRCVWSYGAWGNRLRQNQCHTHCTRMVSDCRPRESPYVVLACEAWKSSLHMKEFRTRKAWTNRALACDRWIPRSFQISSCSGCTHVSRFPRATSSDEWRSTNSDKIFRTTGI